MTRSEGVGKVSELVQTKINSPIMKEKVKVYSEL